VPDMRLADSKNSISAFEVQLRAYNV
jgi:hypothetical protein